MKKSMKLCMAAMTVWALASCGTIGRYRLEWKDDFEKSAIDAAVWSKIPRGRADWNNYMSSEDSLFAVRNGNLILRGVNNETVKNDTAPYLTGGVYTKGKKLFGLGRIEIRAKLGNAQGAWPAFWMLPEKAQWPMGGEIDIMEHLNYDSIAYQTVHSNYTVNLGKKKNPPHYSTGAIKVDDYNVYAVEIHKDSLCFFVNDQHTFTYPRLPEFDKEGQFEFTKSPFYLLIDMQLGGNWVGRVDKTQLPVEMQIDWVKYYKPRKLSKW